jgi:RNA polymerase sigma-70 factor (ECF subfamily)
MSQRVSDAILLERFVRGREEAAFVALVHRHGPLVERVCRRILRNEHDVEDVFQATFFVLARRAAGIPWRDSVSGWLSAVAHRLAMHARSGVARQRGRETTITALRGTGPANGDCRLPDQYHPLIDPATELERQDLRRVLDDELLQLPEKYRAPVVLCYLEGRTHEEAARQLGWPPGSMSRRLDRARTLLRRRLAHRGLVLAAIGLVSAALATLGIGRATDQDHRAVVVREAMAVFKTPSEGGQGIGLILDAISRAEDPLPQTDQIILLAREAARAAERVEALDAGRLGHQWWLYAVAMQRTAWDLAQASQSGDKLAMVTAARRLDTTCLNCHEVFRQ